MNLLPGLQLPTEIGAAGQAFTIFKLRMCGITATEAPEGVPFDVVAFVGGRPVRIQVKTTTDALSKNTIRWRISRGCFGASKDTGKVKDLRPYKATDADIMALVCLKKSIIHFLPVPQAEDRITLKIADMDSDEAAERSLLSALETTFRQEH